MTAIKRGNLFALLFFCYSKKPYLTDLSFVRGSTKGKSVLPYRTKNATHNLSHTQKYMLPNITPKTSPAAQPYRCPPCLYRPASETPHIPQLYTKNATRPLSFHTKKARRVRSASRKKSLVFTLLCTLLNSTHKKARRYFAAGSLQYISESPPRRADIRKSLLSGVEFDNQVRFHHRGIRYIVKLRYKRVLCRQLRRINFQIRREVACLRLDSRHNDSQLL